MSGLGHALGRLLVLSAFATGSIGIAAAEVETPAPSAAKAVVVGRVADSRMMVRRKPRTNFYYLRLKVTVDQVESGQEWIQGAPSLDVRCWREGSEGHHPLPEDGARFRAELVRSAEGYWLPARREAFALLDGSEDRAFPDLPPRHSRTGTAVGVVVGLIALLAMALLRRQRQRDFPPVSAPPDSTEEKEGSQEPPKEA